MGCKIKCVLFDWGNTIMRDFPQYDGPMYLWPNVEVMPGARECISAVGSGRTIALATNALESGEEEIRKALARVELEPLINKIFCFHKIGQLKPSAGFFDYILSDLQLTAGEILMVGDDFQKDIMGAARCGIYGIWLNLESKERRIGGMYDTIYKLDDLAAALSLLEVSRCKTNL